MSPAACQGGGRGSQSEVAVATALLLIERRRFSYPWRSVRHIIIPGVLCSTVRGILGSRASEGVQPVSTNPRKRAHIIHKTRKSLLSYAHRQSTTATGCVKIQGSGADSSTKQIRNQPTSGGETNTQAGVHRYEYNVCDQVSCLACTGNAGGGGRET